LIFICSPSSACRSASCATTRRSRACARRMAMSSCRPSISPWPAPPGWCRWWTICCCSAASRSCAAWRRRTATSASSATSPARPWRTANSSRSFWITWRPTATWPARSFSSSARTPSW